MSNAEDCFHGEDDFVLSDVVDTSNYWTASVWTYLFQGHPLENVKLFPFQERILEELKKENQR